MIRAKRILGRIWTTRCGGNISLLPRLIKKSAIRDIESVPKDLFWKPVTEKTTESDEFRFYKYRKAICLGNPQFAACLYDHGGFSWNEGGKFGCTHPLNQPVLKFRSDSKQSLWKRAINLWKLSWSLKTFTHPRHVRGSITLWTFSLNGIKTSFTFVPPIGALARMCYPPFLKPGSRG